MKFKLLIELFCLKLITALDNYNVYSNTVNVFHQINYTIGQVSNLINSSLIRLHESNNLDLSYIDTMESIQSYLYLRSMDDLKEKLSAKNDTHKWYGSYQYWILYRGRLIESDVKSINTFNNYKIKLINRKVRIRRPYKLKNKLKNRRNFKNLRNRRGFFKFWTRSMIWDKVVYSNIFHNINNIYCIHIYTTQVNTIYSLTHTNGDIIYRLTTGSANNGEFKKGAKKKIFSAKSAAQSFIKYVKSWKKKKLPMSKMYIILVYHGYNRKRRQFRKSWVRSGLSPILIIDKGHTAYNGCQLKHKPRK